MRECQVLPMPKWWLVLIAVGQGVSISLAVLGSERLIGLTLGTTLPEGVAGKRFLVAGMVSGALVAYLYARSLKIRYGE